MQDNEKKKKKKSPANRELLTKQRFENFFFLISNTIMIGRIKIYEEKIVNVLEASIFY